MATINLLPWREERRQQLKKEFLIIFGGFAAVAVVAVLLWQLLLTTAIDNQEARNSFLSDRIRELDKQVAEIAALKRQKQALVERMQVIQSLQGNRPEIVHIFDELVRTLPDGVFYTSVVRAGNSLSLLGTAESNNRVSSLMRQLDASEWFANPNLQVVKANKRIGEQATDFSMRVAITPPVAVVPEDVKKPAKKTAKK
jgi:type IV pilus assembly protein PilN